MFKIGDRVRVVNPPRGSLADGLPQKGATGTVCVIPRSGHPGVCFDVPFLYGHTLEGTCEDRHGRWFGNAAPSGEVDGIEDLELVSVSPFEALVTEMLEKQRCKNADYATPENPWGNFERVAGLLKQYPGFPSDTRVGVAVVYMLKQFDAVMKLLAEGKDGAVETVDDRLNDIATYALIIRCMLKEGNA